MELFGVVAIAVSIVGPFIWAMTLRDKNIYISSEYAELKRQYDYAQRECARLRNENNILRGVYVPKMEGDT